MHRYRWGLYSIIALVWCGAGVWYTLSRASHDDANMVYRHTTPSTQNEEVHVLPNQQHASADIHASATTVSGGSDEFFAVNSDMPHQDTASDMARYSLDTLIAMSAAHNHDNAMLIEYVLDAYMRDYAYDDARQWLESLYAFHDSMTGSLMSPTGMPWETYVYVRINTLGYGSDGIQEYRNTLSHWQTSTQGHTIHPDTFIWHTALLDIVQYNHKGFWSGLEQLTGSDMYADIVRDIYATQELVFEDSPSYYRYALIAKVLFEYGYIDIAHRIADAILIDQPSYILARQIAGYSTFLERSYDESIDHITYLFHHDSGAKQTYILMRAIIAYETNKRQQASLLLQKALPGPYVTRYKILITREMGDLQGFADLYRELMHVDTLTPHDILTFFETMIGHQDMPHTWSMVPMEIKQSIMEVINHCKQYDLSSALCSYGVGWYYVLRSETQQAHDVLRIAMDEYPNEILLIWLARRYRDNTYANNKNIMVIDEIVQQAKHYYTQAMIHSDDAAMQAGYKKELLTYMMDVQQIAQYDSEATVP